MHWIDPDSLSPVKSKVIRFLFNAHGEADGMLLADGTEAHVPPHLSKQVLRSIQPGDVVKLYGVKPRAVNMIACIAIESAGGKRIDDTGPPAKGKKKKRPKRKEDGADDESVRQVEVEDTIERTLHGPKGEVRGILLTGGRIVRFPPHAADGARALLRPGAVIAVRGTQRTGAATAALEARAWGKSKARMKPVSSHPPH